MGVAADSQRRPNLPILIIPYPRKKSNLSAKKTHPWTAVRHWRTTSGIYALPDRKRACFFLPGMI